MKFHQNYLQFKWLPILKTSWLKSSKLKINWVNLKLKIYLKFHLSIMDWPNIIRCTIWWASLMSSNRLSYLERRLDSTQWNLMIMSSKSGNFTPKSHLWRRNITEWKIEESSQRLSMLRSLSEIYKLETRCLSCTMPAHSEDSSFKTSAADGITTDSTQECFF